MNRSKFLYRILPGVVLAVLLAACQPAAQALPTDTPRPPAPSATAVPATLAPTGTPTSPPSPTATAEPVTIVTSASGVPVTGVTQSAPGDNYAEEYGGGNTRKTPGAGGDNMTQTPAAAAGTVVNRSTSDTLGAFLVDAQGMTLYRFAKDSPGQTTCFEGCLANWPPLLTTGQPVHGEGVDDSALGVITRPDGSTQVTYHDLPLYYFAGDHQPGDTNGQGVGGIWFVVEP